MNTTQALQKALDDALVAPTDRLEFGKCNMRLKTNITLKEATFQVALDAFALTPFYQAFLITADVPAIYMQEFWATVSVIKFEDLPLEQDILSFIRDLRHTVDYLHQPWRAFATVINKCLSGKETIMDKIRLSHAQIRWGTNKPAMLESNAYKTYYAFASGEKTPKPKYVQKKVDSDTSPKQKLVQATKGAIIKSEAQVAKSDKKKQHAKKPKAKGLVVLSEVALTEAEQLKLAARKTFTYHKKVAQVMELTLRVLDVPIYESESEKESWGDSDEEDDDDEDDFDDDSDDNDECDDERTKSDRDEIPNPNKTNEEHNEEEEEYDNEFNIEEDEKIDDEETMYDD
ncbi:hypothetical protein Tco_1278539, partial [Tanacetum coccineum]